MQHLTVMVAVVGLMGCSDRDHGTATGAGSGSNARSSARPPSEDMVSISAGTYIATAPVFAPDGKGTCTTETLSEVKAFASQIPLRDRPQEVATFAIDKRRVSCADYETCVSGGVCPPDRGAIDCASDGVEVTLQEAVKYCGWRGATLPTLLQWQAAVRGATGRTAGECDDPNKTACTITNDMGIAVGDVATGSLGEFTSTTGCWYGVHGDDGALRPLKVAPRRLQLYLVAPSHTAAGARADRAEFRCARNQIEVKAP